MAAQQLTVGDVVSGFEPGELVEIRRLTRFGDSKLLVEGVTVESRRLVQRPLTESEVARLERVRGAEFSYDGAPTEFLLGAEAHRIRVAHQFDPLFAVNSSVVDPLPHQVEAVYRYLLPLPRIRFLLADDTGAGKTIMTGLLLKELLFRGVIEKVLVVVPGGLTKQWAEEELGEKFGFPTRLVNRGSFDAEPGQFARSDGRIFVVSMDFLARNEGCLRAAEEIQWDFIAVDEAHKLSAYEYGSKLAESERYKAIRVLARRTDHLLLLTATPHRGRKDTFRRLLLLLDEDLFQKDEHVSARVQEQVEGYGESPEAFESERPITQARNRFFLRRLKEEMVDWDNHPLFKPRHTQTVAYELTPQEKVLYDEVTRYVRSRRREARARKNRNVELTLMVMQRRLASSLYAITRTLENRLAALNEVLALLTDPRRSPAERKRLLVGRPDPGDPRDISEYEELAEDERDLVDGRIFRQVLSDDPEKVEEERNEVARLRQMAVGLRDHREAKFVELLRVLDSSDVMRADEEKLLIFTEHKDTLRSLASRLDERGYTVVTIDGSMDVDARKEAQRRFRRQAKIMVATDAAGEGINLQFCRYLFNWDIPWNPNRLEQRMGRIHRYGQSEDVWVYNLVAHNTREGAVLEKVLSKLDVMREQLGSDRVYDVIDDLLEGVPLVTLIERAIDEEDGTEAIRQTELALQQASPNRAEQLINLQKKASLASRLDLRAARNLRDASDERRLQPLFIQRFFERAWAAAGGGITQDRGYPVSHLGRTPSGLLEVARQRGLPLADHYSDPFVFDKQLVSVACRSPVPERTKLLGPGHPAFDVLLDWTARNAREAFARGAVLIDPNLARPQRVWLVRSTVQDGRRERQRRLAHERLAVVALDHMGLRVTSPSYLLVCVAPENRVDMPELADEEVSEVQAWAYDAVTTPELREVSALRREECELRRQYLTTAFTDLIVELQGKLNDLHEASLFGEPNAEERAKLEERIADLKRRKAERMAELDLMLNLGGNLPEILTKAIVIPAPVAVVVNDVSGPSRGFPMRRDEEVEAIAMDVAMRYERARGWSPVDVSRDGEHYDIRSESSAGAKRFIEVKGRAEAGAIVLTGPEVDKLRQLAERAWLYIVTFCKSERARLRIIQDPIAKLHPEVLYRQVQFLVEQDDWSKEGEEASLALGSSKGGLG